MANNVLKKIKGIKFIFLDDRDVLRHGLVKQIINAYDVHEQEQDSIHDSSQRN